MSYYRPKINSAILSNGAEICTTCVLDEDELIAAMPYAMTDNASCERCDKAIPQHLDPGTRTSDYVKDTSGPLGNGFRTTEVELYWLAEDSAKWSS